MKLSNNFDVGIPKDRRFESLSRNTPFPVAICSLNNTRYIVKTCKNRIKFQVCSNSSTVFFLSWTVEIIMSHVWTKSLPGGEPLQKGLAVHHCQRKISEHMKLEPFWVSAHNWPSGGKHGMLTSLNSINS